MGLKFSTQFRQQIFTLFIIDTVTKLWHRTCRYPTERVPLDKIDKSTDSGRNPDKFYAVSETRLTNHKICLLKNNEKSAKTEAFN